MFLVEVSLLLHFILEISNCSSEVAVYRLEFIQLADLLQLLVAHDLQVLFVLFHFRLDVHQVLLSEELKMKNAREVVPERLVSLLLHLNSLADLIDLFLEVAVRILWAPTHVFGINFWLSSFRGQVDHCAILGYFKMTGCFLDILSVLSEQIICLFEVARVIVYIPILFSFYLEIGLARQFPLIHLR